MEGYLIMGSSGWTIFDKEYWTPEDMWRLTETEQTICDLIQNTEAYYDGIVRPDVIETNPSSAYVEGMDYAQKKLLEFLTEQLGRLD